MKPRPINDTTTLIRYLMDAPATKLRHPFISFAYGMGVATAGYSDNLKSVAAFGYIAIAPDADENN